MLPFVSFSSPPPGGEVRRGGDDVRIPLSQPLPLAGERRKKRWRRRSVRAFVIRRRMLPLVSYSSPPLGGEVRRGGDDVRIPLSQPLPLAGERRKKR
jgi:hypothetical protein